MHVHQLTAYVVRVPLRKPFRHATFQRWHSDNLIVRCEIRQPRRKPIVGWGEGVPRDYVTGETTEDALRQLTVTPLADQLEGTPANWGEVVAMVDRFRPPLEEDDPRDCRSNALRSAVELALLDAYGKLFSEPIGNVLLQLPEVAGLVSPQQWVQYSTTIDATHRRRVGAAALKMRIYGFKQCKVKVGAKEGRDIQRLAKIREWIGPDVDLRLDVNGAWQAEELLTRLSPLCKYDISCVEQPVAHDELEQLAELKPQIPIPVMLDESVTSEVDARRAIALKACDLLNIRLSKCGGLIASARLAALAHRHGLGYQLGCHPGETGILSAAGRQFATTLGGHWYLEGSYDRHLVKLRAPLTRHDMTFGYGGWAQRIDRSGIGTEILPRRLARRVIDSRTFVLGDRVMPSTVESPR